MIPGSLALALSSLADRLTRSGWTIERIEDLGINSDLLVAMESGELQVLLYHDRGEPGIDVKPRTWSSGYSPHAWCRALGISVDEPMDGIESEVRRLEVVLPFIRTAFTGGTITQGDLRQSLATLNSGGSQDENTDAGRREGSNT